MKLNGFTLIIDRGSLDLTATMEAWDAHHTALIAAERAKFIEAAGAEFAAYGKVLPIVHDHLMRVWDKHHPARITKSLVVDMVASSILNADQCTIDQVQALKPIILGYITDNTGAPLSDNLMWQEAARGRNAQIYRAPKEGHIRKEETPAASE